MKMSAPWVCFYRKMEALFAKDPEIKITYDEENIEVKLYVENPRKAEALSQLLPTEKIFGNVTLKITVIPANNLGETKADLIQQAFDGNPVLQYIWPANTPLGSFTYVVFKGEVVQYFNDDMSDINGNCSTLYQEIAKEVLGEESGTFFCTEAMSQALEKPLGEWP